MKDEGNVGKNLGSTLNLAMIFVTPLYLLFYVRERVVNAKHLQFVSGATVSIFWIVSYIWDLLTFILTAVCLIIVIVAFQEKGYNTAPDLGNNNNFFLSSSISCFQRNSISHADSTRWKYFHRFLKHPV